MSGKQKRARLVAELGRSVQQYGRKAQKQGDPNDRRYDRKVEKTMRAMYPGELSALLSGDADHDEPESAISGTVELDEER